VITLSFKLKHTNMKSRLNILITDQSPLVAPRIKELLSDYSSSVITGEARTDGETLLMLELTNIDIVILDVHLPMRMGLTLLHEIKTRHPHIKVIVFSNYAKPLFKNYCLGLGADYFYEKATEFEMIPATINHLLNDRDYIIA
jgi:two-component system response regulator DevR